MIIWHLDFFGYYFHNDPMKDPTTTFTGGTLYYMAPETFRENIYNEKTDVYSFGILMYEVVTEEELYPELKKFNSFHIIAKFNEGKVDRPKFRGPLKKSIKELIESCWSENPDKRPTFEELFHKLAHNSEEWIIDLFEESETNEEYDVFKYFLEDVDSEDVFNYVEEIKDDFQFDQMKMKTNQLEKENQMLKKQLNALQEKVKPIDDILKRLQILEKQIQNSDNKRKEIEVNFDGKEENQKKGIISYIGQGSPQKVIDLFASSSQKNFNLENVFLFENDFEIFYSENKPEEWFAYDFKERKVKLSAYSIKEHGFTKNSHHLISWNIEGSNDNDTWEILDSHFNDETINHCFTAYTFSIKPKEKKDSFYRYIRIKQT